MIELGTLVFGTDVSGSTTIMNPADVKRDYNNNIHVLAKTGKDKVFSITPMCPLCSQTFDTILTFIKNNIGVTVVYKDNRDTLYNVKILSESLDYTVEREWVSFDIKLLEVIT